MVSLETGILFNYTPSISFQELSSPNSPYRPIHITTYNRDPYQNHTMPIQNSIHKPPPSAGHTNYYHQPPSPQFQPPRRQRDTYSQPPFQSPTTPTTPPPPWATRQAAPKRVSKLSQLGGGGFSFGTNYCTLPRRGTRQSWVLKRRCSTELFFSIISHCLFNRLTFSNTPCFRSFSSPRTAIFVHLSKALEMYATLANDKWDTTEDLGS